MSDDIKFRDFTAGEKASLVLLHARMAWRGMAGPEVDLSDLQKKVERVERRTERRKNGK